MLIFNAGEIPIQVMNYRLGNGCSGNGFSLTGCVKGGERPFLLRPCDYHSFYLEFKSDCAASFSAEYLYVDAILGEMLKKKHYTVNTMKIPIKVSVSSSILPECAEAYLLHTYGQPQMLVK